MWSWKQKLAIIGLPAVLAIGGSAVVANAAGRPGSAPITKGQVEPSGASSESSEIAPETAEANEPNLPGGGHSDPAGQTDHQFDGSE